MDIYAENILDHSKHPHHSGALTDASATHREHNPSCGDTITLSLKIDGGQIIDIGWSGDGCAISQAGMSILSDALVGKTVDEANTLDADAIKRMLGVPVGTRRLKCALLSLHTLKNTLRTYHKKPTQTWHDTVGNGEETR